MINLHSRTIFSPGRSLLKVDELIGAARKSKQQAVAITDIDNLYGAVKFYKACKSSGIKPIIGATVGIAENLDSKLSDVFPLVLLAKNQIGYSNLCKIITHANFNAVRKRLDLVGRTTLEYIQDHSDGLIAITTPEGHLYSAIKKDSQPLFEHYVSSFKKIFQNNFYVMTWPGSDKRADEYFFENCSDNLIIGNNLHYLSQNMWRYYSMMESIRRMRKYAPTKYDEERILYFMTKGELEKYYSRNILTYLDRTEKIADECNFEFDTKPKFPKVFVDNPDEYLKQKINEGFVNRKHLLKLNGKKQKYLDRIRQEFEVISSLGFSSYFIVVQDILNEARRRNILVGPGRGSIGGSLIGFSLGIHDLDPIENELYFQRFLHMGRKHSPPDIDCDFEDTRRDELFTYLEDKYGLDKTSGVGNIGTSALKMSMKDVGKSLGVSFEEMNILTKLVPFKAETFDDCMKHFPFELEYNNNSRLREIMRYVNVLVGAMRNANRHAAGIVIAPDDITNYVPLQLDNKSGKQITQFDKNAIEEIGLIKFDLLGLTALSTIHECLDNIQDRTKEQIDLLSISDEPKVYEMLAKGYTSGVFQLEGNGITQMAKTMDVKSFKDVRDLIALYRPAVIVEKQDEIYFKNKFADENNQQVLHPLLKDILKETYQVMLYQEQTLKMVSVLAGFSLERSELLRKSVGKKNKELMEKVKEEFREGCRKNNISDSDIEKIIKILDSAVGYQFNKAHSAEYATITYRTAYLKYFYPLEYFTALFNSEKKSIDKVERYINDAKRMRVYTIQPNINESEEKFTISADNKIIFGLGIIKGLGKAAEYIMQIRGNQPFESMYNFMERIDLSIVDKSVLYSLAYSGCFDCFDIRREQVAENADKLIKFYKKLGKTNCIIRPTLMLPYIEPKSPGFLSNKERELIGYAF